MHYKNTPYLELYVNQSTFKIISIFLIFSKNMKSLYIKTKTLLHILFYIKRNLKIGFGTALAKTDLLNF